MPILIPVEEVCVLFKALGKVVEAEPIVDCRIRHIRLGDKGGRGVNILLFLPVHGNFCLTRFENFLLFTHDLPSLLITYRAGRHLVTGTHRK